MARIKLFLLRLLSLSSFNKEIIDMPISKLREVKTVLDNENPVGRTWRDMEATVFLRNKVDLILSLKSE